MKKSGKGWTKPENIVTSGAFKLTETSPKNRTVVQRNRLFWNNADTKLENIIFISDEKVPAGSEFPETTRERYEKGETDAVFVTSLPDESLKNRKDYSLTKSAGTEFFHLNTSIKPFSDVRVRRAFNLAINRERLAEMRLQT